MKQHRVYGFTLIEMSIVLVIIGLIIGSILVGQDLIKGATIKAQLNQIEKYSSAVNAFTNKYGQLPGDLQPNLASQFGFTVGTNCTGTSVGTRDGNSLIDAWPGGVLAQALGETGLFWSDLSAAGYVDGSFPNGGASSICYNGGTAPNPVTATTATQYFPAAKIGRGNEIYVFDALGVNWFGLSAFTSTCLSNTNLTVADAYSMDKKVDDGLPTTGAVQAIYVNNSCSALASAPSAVSDGSTTCYNTTNNTYSLSISNGLYPNCAVSFKFPQ